MKTTFLLPSGSYRYLRVPQGLNASSDKWCRRSDTVLDGLPWAKKIVDDILVWAPLIPELRIIVETLLCNECQERRPKQQTNPRVTNPPSSAYGAPMAHVGLDLFDYAGKKHLICVDKWSGFPLYKRLNSTTTQSIINVLETWFNILGWPSNIRSDGGPQFLGPISFCVFNVFHGKRLSLIHI